MYDKDYIYEGVQNRIDVLEGRYRMYCNGTNEVGDDLTPAGAAVARSKCKTDLGVLQLIYELIGHIDHEFVVSDEAAKGYERLCEPYERHRNFRG